MLSSTASRARRPLGLLRRAASTLRPDPADLVPAADAAEAASQQPVGLSVKQRLKQVQIDHEVLVHIERLGLGMPPRGREHRRRAPEPQPLVKRARVHVGFMGAAHDSATLPEALGPEVAFAGRSNVGKSSLLNAVVGKSCGSTGTIGIAAVRNLPGVTKSINFYGKGPAGADGPKLVDLPGYGYAFANEQLAKQWQETMRQYMLERDAPTLRVLLLIDARQSLRSSDKDFCLFLEREANLRYHVVMSKCDLVPRAELAKRYALLTHELNELQLRGLRRPVLMVSARTGAGVNELRGAIADVIPVPQKRATAAAASPADSAAAEELGAGGGSGARGGRDLVGRRLRDDILDEAGRRWEAKDGAEAAVLPDWRITSAVRDRLRHERRISAEQQQSRARGGRRRGPPPTAEEHDVRLSELDESHQQRSAYETWARRQKRKQGSSRRS